ncbi:hypothetical protein QCN29_02490 [Streptomyces sp. HNM0663]|uniref:XRE family transcriptional regulator n=1 Tax=Streptomyces chengmaiensis TaxID=3040919 RepID=A0ABT6HFX9_9ACTN|nr:hypothetical protein [Streptomyces chengmaiensis]MDH2387673.1 hypothetical protein [Streptomyces chengmaiensis]
MNDRLLAWFPLIQRPRPPALPLDARVRQLTDLAAQPATGNIHQQAVRAAEICNKAALIASDCALPDLARHLCWSQYAVFDQARPLPTWAVKLALQPLLNIARQLIREGDGTSAHAMLEALFHAARARTSTEIAGRTVHLHRLTSSADGHKTVVTLVWAALLADGTRALAQAGRWHEAAAAAAAHRGVGARLLDGRQITILALAHNRQHDEARALIENSRPAEPWEDAVQHLLSVAYREADAVPAMHIDAMLTAVLALQQQPAPGTAVFRTRAGITALTLAAAHPDERIPLLQADVLAMAHADGYAARDVLTHPPLRRAMTTAQRQALTSLVRAAGLGAGTIPAPLCSDLMRAVQAGEERLRHSLERDAVTSPTAPPAGNHGR